jgi:SAM-dependent methyltransferase
MAYHSRDAHRAYWDNIFSHPTPVAPAASTWIEDLLALASLRLQGNGLEIGCGRGTDTRYLLNIGCNVTCLDLSWSALQNVGCQLPAAGLVHAALPDPLPFRSGVFSFVIAGLSLHYFRWRDTSAIVAEIGRVLQPGGILLFRVNAIEDVAHGAGRGVEIEPNLYLYEGRYKRFFTEKTCRDLFDETWEITTLIPQVELRFHDPKPTWAGIGRQIAPIGEQ